MKKDTSIQSVIVPVTGSISDRSFLDQVSVYPNPAQNVLHIESPLPTQKIKVSIANLLGSVILPSTEVVVQSMDITSLSSGIYVLTIQDETSGASITRKFVKE
jgi:aminopeptidase YwaD